MLCTFRAFAGQPQSSSCVQTLQRRCYWMLEGDGDIVLVHYLVAGQGSRIRATTAAQNAAAAQVCAEALSELGTVLKKEAMQGRERGGAQQCHASLFAAMWAGSNACAGAQKAVRLVCLCHTESASYKSASWCRQIALRSCKTSEQHLRVQPATGAMVGRHKLLCLPEHVCSAGTQSKLHIIVHHISSPLQVSLVAWTSLCHAWPGCTPC